MQKRALLVIVGISCSAPAPAPIAHSARAPQAKPAPEAMPVADPKCAGELTTHRETLVRDQGREVTAGGLRATYRGRSRDVFDDGTTATMLSLELFGEPWLPDARDQGFHAFGDHCVRIVTSSEARIELEIAVQPAHQYDDTRCQVACCQTAEQRKPAPDGTVECCFCSDAPKP